jgi:hypothetical protein
MAHAIRPPMIEVNPKSGKTGRKSRRSWNEDAQSWRRRELRGVLKLIFSKFQPKWTLHSLLHPEPLRTIRRI